MASALNLFTQRAASIIRGSVLRSSLYTTQTVTIQKRCLPICAVDTNLNKTQVPKDFNEQFSKVVAKMLNKPEKLISITLKTEVDILRNGNAEPTVAIQIWSIGVFDQERNPGYAKELFPFLEKALGLPTDRIAVMFHPIEKKDAAHLLYADFKANQ